MPLAAIDFRHYYAAIADYAFDVCFFFFRFRHHSLFFTLSADISPYYAFHC